MKYIFTNFGSGNGPYLRTIEMAINLIKLLKEKLNEEIGVIVPLIYGENQKKIIEEEFNEFLKNNPNQILLDAYLGKEIKRILYDGRDFNYYMKELISHYDSVEKNVQNYLKGEFYSKDLNNNSYKVKGQEIIFEISRNPAVATNIKNSYYTSIGYFEKMIQETIKNTNLKLNKRLLERILPISKKIESYQLLHFQPEPNCFSYETNSQPFKKSEVKSPPLIKTPLQDKRTIEHGVYILISGIPNLKKIYKIAKDINLKIYTNQIIEDFPNAQKESPTIIFNDYIKFVIARPAWNTIWLSNMSKKPFFYIDYTQGDFPEIYFNIKTIKKNNLGIQFNKKLKFEEYIDQAKDELPKIENFYSDIKDKFGTLNGIQFTSRKIAYDFLKNRYE